MAYYDCEIKFKDDDSIFTSLIKDSYDIDENTDDQVFYYCNSVKQIEQLTKEDNGEDFVILNYQLTDL